MSDIEGVGFLTDVALPWLLIATIAVMLTLWLLRIFLFVTRENRKLFESPENKNETLNAPKGLVRSFFVLFFAIITALIMFNGDDIVAAEDKKWILAEFGGIVAFYFGSKAIERKSGSD